MTASTECTAESSVALFTVEQLRKAEGRAAALLPSRTLMLRAATAIADLASKLVSVKAGAIVILAGPGNNGGDALEAALLLHQRWLDVTVICIAEPASDDARLALKRCMEAGVRVVPWGDGPQDCNADVLSRATLVVDGMFGIGLTRGLAGASQHAAHWLNTHAIPVLAIDIPSGLDADTGCVVASHTSNHTACDGEPIAVKATITLTMIGAKAGLFTADGVDHAGNVVVADLGAFAFLAKGSSDQQSNAWLNHPCRFGSALKPRAHNTHKGSFGSVAIAGGSAGMLGALLLAGRTALHAGAGRVYLHPLGDCPSVDPLQPELMIRSVEQLDFKEHAVVIGPGLGMEDRAMSLLESVLRTADRLVLDADALNLIAREPQLSELLKTRSEPARKRATIMTPHPLEAARLLGVDVAEVNSNRVRAACSLATRFSAEIVLKGAGSVLAFTDGSWAVNPTGNAGLASGGTGDVLAGLCGALLASAPMGATPSSVLGAATWLHGQAADDLVALGCGPVGLTASELPLAIRTALNRLVQADAGFN
jgi:hydroxyethylthiazole kinase-like uncharacterized protein yjeF